MIAGLPPIRGHLAAHDPSTIVRCQDRYYVFSTGRGILSKSSRDLIFWESGPPVFATPPSWTSAAVPDFDGTFWAPDVIHLDDRYFLYYSVSSWGGQVSAIGLVTNPTLDPTDPNYRWTDHGPVIQSANSSPYNAIDASVLHDASGKLWLAFGSYWNGIYTIELDPTTGLRIAPGSPLHRLAHNGSIEAACLHQRAGYYYLFVNWGSCCSGVNSTYHVRVGRSRNATGPFLDRTGRDLVNQGGSLFLESTGKYVGPGHVGILSEAGQDRLSYHYYDANAWAANYGAYGPARLAIAPLDWSPDDWPVFANNWSALYLFLNDARDEHRQYHGLLPNGASFPIDPHRGPVLDLDGVNQSVSLPPGVGYARTFIAVVKWRGGAPNQRILDFGAGTARGFRLTPASDNNVLRCEIDAGNGIQSLEWTRPLPTNQWTQVAVTFDGARGVLYVNGIAVATRNNFQLSPIDARPQTNYLGRSSVTPSCFFNGQFAIFEARGQAVSATEIRAPVVRIDQPADGAAYTPNTPVEFAGAATDFMRVSLGSNAITWQADHVSSNSTSLVFGPTTGVARGSFVPPQTASGALRLTLSAIDNAQRQTATVSTLVPGQAWRALYPFTTGGTDANDRFNGVLEGGATIEMDPLLGGVLSLNGDGQYLALPADVASLQTLAALVRWNGGPPRQRIFDLGRGTRARFSLTPKDSSGRIQCSITPDQFSYAHSIESDTPFPVGQWTHVAVTLDGRQGILYLNGKPVGVNNSVNLLPADLGVLTCWLGKSQSPADPFFNGQLDSVLLDSTALWPESTVPSPPLRIRTADQTLRLQWPLWAGALRLASASRLTPSADWSFATREPSLVADSLALDESDALPSRFYRLQWPWCP